MGIRYLTAAALTLLATPALAQAPTLATARGPLTQAEKAAGLPAVDAKTWAEWTRRYNALPSVVAAAVAKVPTPTPPTIRQLGGINLSGLEYNGGKVGAKLYHDYVTPSDATYAAVKAAGFSRVRLPISQEHLQPDPAKALLGVLAEPYASEVIDAVVRGQRAGLNVLVDLHNYGRYYGNQMAEADMVKPGRNIRGMYVGVVGALAKRLASVDAYGLAVTNEPHDISIADVTAMQQAAVDVARAAGFKGQMVVSDAGWSTAYDGIQVDVRDPLTGKLACVDGHAYGDGDNSGTYRQAMKDDGTTANTIVDRLRPFVEQAERQTRCVVVGEFGAPTGDPGRREQVANAVTYLAQHKVDGYYWLAGEWSGNDASSLQPGLAPNGASAMVGVLAGNR